MLHYNTAYFAHHERVINVFKVPSDDKFDIVYCRYSNMNCIFRAFFRNSFFTDKRFGTSDPPRRTDVSREPTPRAWTSQGLANPPESRFQRSASGGTPRIDHELIAVPSCRDGAKRNPRSGAAILLRLPSLFFYLKGQSQCAHDQSDTEEAVSHITGPCIILDRHAILAYGLYWLSDFQIPDIDDERDCEDKYAHGNQPVGHCPVANKKSDTYVYTERQTNQKRDRHHIKGNESDYIHILLAQTIQDQPLVTRQSSSNKLVAAALVFVIYYRGLTVTKFRGVPVKLQDSG